MAKGSASKWKVEAKGAKAVQKAFVALGENQSVYLRPAYQAAGDLSGRAVAGASPVSVSAKVSVLGKGAKTWAKMKIGKHPALKSFQFGRKKYYRGYSGRAVSSGSAFTSSPGFTARPFIGGALDSQAETVSRIISEAYDKEFARVVGQGD